MDKQIKPLVYRIESWALGKLQELVKDYDRKAKKLNMKPLNKEIKMSSGGNAMNEYVKKYPVILADGTIAKHEIVTDRSVRYYNSTAAIEGRHAKSALGVHFGDSLFKRETFKVALDPGRIACVEVFVSEDFQSLNKSRDSRLEIIRRIIQDNTAWIFTYGERIDREVF